MLRTASMVLVLGLVFLPTVAWAAPGPGGVFEIEVVDRQTRQPLACRMHLTNADGKALKAPRVPFWHDHFTFDGKISLKLPKGDYDFTIEHGLEYGTQSGRFTMDNFSKDRMTIELERFADLAAEGWWSGDLDVARPAIDLPLLMRAEDLHVVTLITWPGREALLPANFDSSRTLVKFDTNRFVHVAAGLDERNGGALLLLNLDQPPDAEAQATQHDAIQATNEGAGWVDARSAAAWDLPLWAASGNLDSLQILNNATRRSGPPGSAASDKPREETSAEFDLASTWPETIYFHLLNCGLRIPPTAGSASGEFANPLGFNRMYVHVAGELTYQRWWDGVRAGRVVITNGPLLRPMVEGEVPGFVFKAERGQQVELEMALSFASREGVAAIEVIKNGQLAHSVPIPDLIQAGGQLPTVLFEESGWLLFRATAGVANGSRLAMTAPYYVQIGESPRISKKSAEFFRDWITQRAAAAKSSPAAEPYEQAIAYWDDLVQRANAP